MKKEKIKTAIVFILFLFLIVLGASIIKDVLYLIFKNTINETLFLIINLALIFAFVFIMWKTPAGKYLDKKLSHKKN